MAISANSKHLLLLGGQTEMYEKAKKANLRVTLIQEKDWMKEGDFSLVDRVINAPIDANYIVELIGLLHKEDPFDFVLSFLEAGLLNAANISDLYGIPGNSLMAVECTRYKSKMREKMQEKSVNTIPFKIVKDYKGVKDFSKEYGYPVILKSARGSGSRNIHKITSEENIDIALKDIQTAYPAIDIIVEKFISGMEISVEAFSWNGKHTIVACTDKMTTGEPLFVEIGHTVPSSIEPNVQEKVEYLTKEFLDAIEQKFGPSHTEIIIKDGNPYIIESHTRPGGSFIFDLVKDVYGVDFFTEAFNRINNSDLPDKIVVRTGKHTAATIRHFHFPEGRIKEIKGLEVLENNPNITRFDFSLKTDQEIKNFKNSEERYGYVQIVGNSMQKVKQNVEDIMSGIVVDVY
jgi:biotin carboxylase